MHVLQITIVKLYGGNCSNAKPQNIILNSTDTDTDTYSLLIPYTEHIQLEQTEKYNTIVIHHNHYIELDHCSCGTCRDYCMHA